MSVPVVIDRSPDPERPQAERAHEPSIASWVRSMGPTRAGALLLVASTLVAIVWANAWHEG